MPEESVTGVEEHAEAECRSATTNTFLGIGAAGVAAPFVAPYVHKAIGKLTGPKDDGPQVIIPPGTVSPSKDD